MNQPTTADIIKVVGQLLIEARELQELKKGLNRDRSPAELAHMEERLARAQSLLSQLCKDPVLVADHLEPVSGSQTHGRPRLLGLDQGRGSRMAGPARRRDVQQPAARL